MYAHDQQVSQMILTNHLQIKDCWRMIRVLLGIIWVIWINGESCKDA